MPNGQGGSPFDLLETAVVKVINQLIGYKATWLPSTGGPLKEGRVLFNDPTRTLSIQNMNFDDENPWMEYQFGIFDGLRELANVTRNNEELNIYFTKTGPPTTYYVRKVKTKWDGKAHIGKLQLKTD